MMKPWWILAAGVLLAAGLAMVGCPGRDGRDSSAGAPGTENRETSTMDDTLAEDGARSKKSRERNELSAHRYIREKLKSIIIPKIAFEDTSLEEAIDFLRLRMRELDPDPDPVMRGVSLRVRKATVPEGEFVLGSEMDRRIRDLKMENTSAWDLLHLVAREFRMNVEITDTGIELVPP